MKIKTGNKAPVSGQYKAIGSRSKELGQKSYKFFYALLTIIVFIAIYKFKQIFG